jgi:hypothetical protein
MSLEMQKPNGRWLEKWNNKTEYFYQDWNEARFSLVEDAGFLKLTVDISEDHFRKFQIGHGSEATEFDVPLQVSWKDGSETVLA